MGTGGRSAMAGGVYYYDPVLKAAGKLPEYYDHTLFVFEWMRDWVKAVKLNENGEVKSIEPFLPSVEFSSPMDMAIGKDGAMYVLEYGSGWYSDNNDAKLSRIEYVSGNRPPLAKASASIIAGAAPLKVKFSSQGTLDYDEDPLTYAWRFTPAATIHSRKANPEYTFTQPGTYPVKLTVADSKGQKSTANLEVIVGNSKPEVAIQVKGNTTFFWDNDKVNYRVLVKDKEDGSLAKGTIKPGNVYVFLDYIADGDNLSPVITGQQTIMRNDLNVLHPGKVLIDQSDCKSCHAPEKNSIGPSYKAIASRYKGNTEAMNRLAEKIIKGGGGAWDRDFVMVAHPQLSKKATLEMVKYIMTYAEDKPETQRLSPQGEVVLAIPKGKNNEGSYRITALYTDRGARNVKKLSEHAYVVLRSPRVQAENYDDFKGLKVIGNLEDGDNRYLGEINHNAYTLYKSLDLTGIDRLTYQFSANGPGGLIEVHLDSINGPKVSSARLIPTGAPDAWKTETFPLQPQTGKHDLYLVYRAEGEEKRNLFNLNWLFFEKAEPKL
jgi:cytochrome c